MRFVLCLITLIFAGSGCSIYQYRPKWVARGELTIRSSGYGVKFYGGNTEVASSVNAYDRLDDYVRCVPRARMHARQAFTNYVGGGVLAGVGVALGLTSVIVFLVDTSNYGWSVGLGVTAALATGGSVSMRHSSLGHAVDAMNYYNDAIGSLGGTCNDNAWARPRSFPPEALGGPPPSPTSPK